MVVSVGQNVFDIAIQEYANVENIIDIINDNDLDFNYSLTAGVDLVINNDNKGDEETKRFLVRNAVKPSHAIEQTEYLAKYENDTLITTESGEFIIVT